MRKNMLDKIISEKWLKASAVIGIYPASSVDHDDIEVIGGNGRMIKHRFHSIRQQTRKPAGQYNVALADFIRPKNESEHSDYIGAFAVTAGIGIDEHVKRFEKDHDDYSAIILKALADRLAEAFAELMHLKVRKEYWGYSSSENFTNEQLIREEYPGIRPAPGYPAQPDHTEKRTIWNLLDVEKSTGIVLTESLAMVPTASVSGLYFSHPQAHYFGVGKITKEQVEDYAKRKNMTFEEAERWLGPALGY
jgi:5-methyltetrahydrofolate--homocysteine methyltransferase